MKQEWITDRLPEEEEVVLISVKAGTITEAGTATRDFVDVAFFFTPEQCGGLLPAFEPLRPDKCMEDGWGRNVTAWMPLPEPYKGDEE